MRLTDGDRAAFPAIYEAAWPLVRGFALRSVGAEHDAEDVAQHALMKVFSRSGEFRPDGDALSWILGITAFECKTLRKKTERRRESFSEEAVEAEECAPSAEDLYSHHALERAVRDVLQGLSSEEQQTILASLEEMERPDIPGATYRKRLERALGKMRVLWRKRYE